MCLFFANRLAHNTNMAIISVLAATVVSNNVLLLVNGTLGSGK